MIGHKGGMSMSTPAEKAAAYLSRLEADRRAAIAVSEAKAEEAKLIKARQKGFEEALEILGLQISPDNSETKTIKSFGRQRRNIPQLIIRELSFSGTAMGSCYLYRGSNQRARHHSRQLKSRSATGAPGKGPGALRQRMLLPIQG